ncbi:MAG: HDOD domain-containing protein [Deltaproteobacteria bacterium]|nr:HDOD domain-containing protein [Deltaproteobacteria bacterium]
MSLVIENDQAISSKILKLVNSAFFGLGSKVGNIPHAITLLGFNTVRNAVISVSVIKLLSDISDMEDFKIGDFWTHSISVAVASKHIANTTHLHNPDDCFIGGLLHDIGKLVMINNLESLFKEVLKTKKDENISFFAAEKKFGAMNHAQIGGYLASRWKLPAALSDTIARHHSISEMAIDANLLKIVHSADIIINNLDLIDSDSREKLKIPDDLADKIREELQPNSEWFKALMSDIDEGCSFFKEEGTSSGR